MRCSVGYYVLANMLRISTTMDVRVSVEPYQFNDLLEEEYNADQHALVLSY